MTTIAIDAMGGYHPDEVLAAVAEASKFRDELSEQPVFFTLVGDERTLTTKLSALSHNPERIQVVHAPERVGMGESPQRAFNERPLNATTVACELVASGHADAVVSAGNPGLAVLSAREHFTLIEGIERGLADVEAGRTISHEDAMVSLRQVIDAAAGGTA